MTIRTKLLIGGVALAVAGAATLSLMSFTALRNEVNRTSDIVYWTAVKDSADAALVGTYLERYPDGMFAKLALARMDELKRTPAQLADAGKAAGEMKAKAEAEAARILAEAKAQADRAAAAAKAEMARAEQAKAEAERQAKLAADRAAADRAAAEKAAAEKTMAEAKAAAEKAAAEKTAAEAKAAAAKQAVAAAAAAAAAARGRAPQAPGAAPAPSGAAFVVISSTADGLKKGDRVAPSQAISVPTGTRVVLMDAAGKVMTVRGPFNGEPGAGESSGIIGRLSEALSSSSDAPRRIGAFRGVGKGIGLSGGGMIDPWAVDSAQSGNWCVAAERGVVLAGGPHGVDSVTVEMLPSGPKSNVPWPKSQANVPWPASVPVKNGATYQIRYGVTATSVTLHLLERKTASPGQVALWMAEKGCQSQAAAMIDSLERGVAGRLFDLEIGGDRAQGAYRIGEELKLSVRPSRDAYVYCFYKDVAGEVTKIFPSQYDSSARVGAGAQPIPSPSWEAPMQLTGPAGAAEVRCFAVDRDATAQLPPEIAKPGFTVLSAQVAGALLDLFKRVPEGSVATAAMPITVRE
ncbi:MAG: DUF4384 domain-containing protein [Rhodospirillales bacterium]